MLNSRHGDLGSSKRREKRSEKDETSKPMYARLKKYIAGKRQLDRHGFPRPDVVAGMARFCNVPPTPQFNDTEYKTCIRCKKEFVLPKSGELEEVECKYHYGRDRDGHWTCCNMLSSTTGCTTNKYHVHADNANDRSGYVTTTTKSSNCNPGVYAIDCEMSYSVQGRELTRVSIVDHQLETVYDTYVKPYGKILCYHTQLGGVTEENLRRVTTTLEDVQSFMLDNFSSDTILIGHSLESDFVALRLLHETVFDTSLVFSNPRGLPYKYALRTLARKKLGKIVQDGVHDSVEDAKTCMQLALTRLQN